MELMSTPLLPQGFKVPASRNEDPSRRLRRLLATKPYVFGPGVYDPMGAELTMYHGFDAVYFSGYSFAIGHLGTTDMDLYSSVEIADGARRTVSALRKFQLTMAMGDPDKGVEPVHLEIPPVVVDMDAGYGNLFNVHRRVCFGVAAPDGLGRYPSDSRSRRDRHVRDIDPSRREDPGDLQRPAPLLLEERQPAGRCHRAGHQRILGRQAVTRFRGLTPTGHRYHSGHSHRPSCGDGAHRHRELRSASQDADGDSPLVSISATIYDGRRERTFPATTHPFTPIGWALTQIPGLVRLNDHVITVRIPGQTYLQFLGCLRPRRQYDALYLNPDHGEHQTWHE